MTSILALREIAESRKGKEVFVRRVLPQRRRKSQPALLATDLRGFLLPGRMGMVV